MEQKKVLNFNIIRELLLDDNKFYGNFYNFQNFKDIFVTKHYPIEFSIVLHIYI